jgi:hypothetical protein
MNRLLTPDAISQAILDNRISPGFAMEVLQALEEKDKEIAKESAKWKGLCLAQGMKIKTLEHEISSLKGKWEVADGQSTPDQRYPLY